jgi:hypothetical protein
MKWPFTMLGGPVSYQVSESLLEAWSVPLERVGCTIERLSDRKGVTRAIIRRDNAKVSIGFHPSMVLLIFYSSLFAGKGKNAQLAQDVEKTLLGSGAKLYGQGFSSHLMYRVASHPDEPWLERLNAANLKVRIAGKVDSIDVRSGYPYGEFLVEGRAIRFSTGPAILAQANHVVHYIAVGCDSEDLALPCLVASLRSVDDALTRHGASRLVVHV